VIRRRDATVTLGVGTIIAPLSGCLDFAGLRPDGDNDRDSDTAEENPTEDRSGGDRNNEQQADDSDSDNEDDLDDDVDEVPDADDGSEDSDDGPPDPGKVQQRDAGEDVLEFGGLRIIDYTEAIDEFEEDEYADGQVRYTGEVGNTGDEAYGPVTVEMRVYNEDGEELDSHRDLTPEIAADEAWRFEITPHSRSEEITDHDIAVFTE
jgi:hypothetical protein